MAIQEVNAVIFKDADSDQWVAVCLEYDVIAQGDSEQHAADMLKEALLLHIDDMTQEELDALYQPIEGEPRLRRLIVDAPSILRR